MTNMKCTSMKHDNSPKEKHEQKKSAIGNSEKGANCTTTIMRKNTGNSETQQLEKENSETLNTSFT